MQIEVVHIWTRLAVVVACPRPYSDCFTAQINDTYTLLMLRSDTEKKRKEICSWLLEYVVEILALNVTTQNLIVELLFEVFFTVFFVKIYGFVQSISSKTFNSIYTKSFILC